MQGVTYAIFTIFKYPEKSCQKRECKSFENLRSFRTFDDDGDDDDDDDELFVWYG